LVLAFLPVAAPATEIPDPENEFYKSNEELQAVIAEGMRTKYKMRLTILAGHACQP
jgi:hypothetical protein